MHTSFMECRACVCVRAHARVCVACLVICFCQYVCIYKFVLHTYCVCMCVCVLPLVFSATICVWCVFMCVVLRFV